MRMSLRLPPRVSRLSKVSSTPVSAACLEAWVECAPHAFQENNKSKSMRVSYCHCHVYRIFNLLDDWNENLKSRIAMTTIVTNWWRHPHKEIQQGTAQFNSERLSPEGVDVRGDDIRVDDSVVVERREAGLDDSVSLTGVPVTSAVISPLHVEWPLLESGKGAGGSWKNRWQRASAREIRLTWSYSSILWMSPNNSFPPSSSGEK